MSRLTEELCKPSFYHDESATLVECIETHISAVFLTDRFAYKLKKPVQFDFLNWTALAARHLACCEEVRLNRRLAPDVYLGVLPITRGPRGKPQLDGTGEVLDWVVKMRRLPANHGLDRMIDSGRVKPSDIDRVAQRLVDFLVHSLPALIRTDTYRQQFIARIEANRDELLRSPLALDQDQIRRVHAAQLRTVQLNEEMLSDRVRDGRIIDGHGDLKPEHIYLLPTPTIVDCIEFSAELRHIDVIDELAFLAMECDRLGASWIGEQIIETYSRASSDRPPEVLIDFYKSYRASVRAKVLSLRSASEQGAKADAYCQEIVEYLDLADRYVRRTSRPQIIVVRGFSGSGKTFLAESLADRLQMQHLQADQIRQEMFGTDCQSSGYGQAVYREENRECVYHEMIRRAAKELKNQTSVILDGTFLTSESRFAAVNLAHTHDADVFFIDCQCPEDIIAKRLSERAGDQDTFSHATFETYRRQLCLNETDPIDLAPISIDTTESLPDQVAIVMARLRPASKDKHKSGAPTHHDFGSDRLNDAVPLSP